MTAKQRHHRRHAIAAAVASLSAGLLATGLAVYTQANPYAFTSAPSAAKTSSESESGGTTFDDTTASAESEFLPRLDARAVPEVAEIDLPRMTIVGGTSRARLARATRKSEATCKPYWRSLDTGPVGRHVLVTCPGASNVPPEPAERLSLNRESKLPTLAMFNRQLPPLKLDSDLAPSANRADHAGTQVNLALNRQSNHLPASTAGGAQDVAKLPVQNPLSWAPTQGSAS
jgi:hypothetical protein